MKLKSLVFALLICISACSPEKKEKSELIDPETVGEIAFEKEKWAIKKGEDYPYRDQMLSDVIYNDTVRTLSKDEIVQLLGEPDRSNEGHLYYLIDETQLGSWTLHSKTLVVKIAGDNTIEWIKIHE